jgi:hypothetical protein
MDSPVDLLRWQFGAVHALLDASSVAPPRLLVRYAELVVLEDVTVQTVLAGRAPLALSMWRGRTGVRPLPPLRRCWHEQNWANNVLIDPAKLQNYAQAVYAATDAFLTGSASKQDRLTVCVLTALLMSLSTWQEIERVCQMPAVRQTDGEAIRAVVRNGSGRPSQLAPDCREQIVPCAAYLRQSPLRIANFGSAIYNGGLRVHN